jgi:hypothetical protein
MNERYVAVVLAVSRGGLRSVGGGIWELKQNGYLL